MRKCLLLFIALIGFALLTRAQFDTSFAKTNLRHCADSLVHGFRTRNWEVVARYSNPAMIGTMGGKQAFMNYIAASFAGVPDTAWKVYKTGKILQVVKTATDLQAVIELHSVVEWEGRRVTSTLDLIGQSWDGGLFWTFFDSQNNINAVKTIKPDLSPDLLIPPKNEKMENISPAQANKILSPPPSAVKSKQKTKSK
jgi:hypothetical protein